MLPRHVSDKTTSEKEASELANFFMTCFLEREQYTVFGCKQRFNCYMVLPFFPNATQRAVGISQAIQTVLQTKGS